MGYSQPIGCCGFGIGTLQFLFLLIQILCLSPPVIHGQIEIKKTNKYALPNTGTTSDPERVYKFPGYFEEYRAKQIADIADWNGSIQSNDALEYEEFVKIQEENLTEEDEIEDQYFTEERKIKYRKIVEKLIKSVEEFSNKNLHGLSISSINAGLKKEEKRQRKIKFAKVGKMHNLVVACKIFMAQLMSEEGPGSWIDVFSFMNSGNDEFSPLKRIYEIAKRNSKSIDRAINSAIYEQHQRNGRRKQRAVIEGGGPAGLYATFQLFLAGMEVSMVNDRSNHYERNRVVFMDPKWINQLRYFLGTKFHQTFVDENGKGELNRGDVGFISCKSLETVLSRRLYELAEYVQQRKAFEVGKTGGAATNSAAEDDRPLLELIYDTAVLDIQRLGKTAFFAVTGKPDRKRSESEEDGDENRDEEIDSSNLESEGNATDLKYPTIRTDLLVFAGGKNDRVRTKLMGAQQNLTTSLYYGVTALTRGRQLPALFPEQLLFLDGTPMAELAPHLEERALNHIVTRMAAPNRPQFSRQFVAKYKEMNKVIMEGAEKVINLRMFQIKTTLNIAYPMPKQLIEFFDAIEQEKLNKTKKQQKAIQDFRVTFIRLWSAALFDFALKKSGSALEGKEVLNLDADGKIGPFDEGKLNFDTEPVNVSTGAFSSHVMAVEEAMDELGGDKNGGKAKAAEEDDEEDDEGLALMAAVGDANTSFFLRASGFSTARMSVEFLAYEIRDYNRGILTKGQLLNGLKRKLNSIKYRAVKLVEDYVKPLPGKEHLALPPPAETIKRTLSREDGSSESKREDAKSG